MESEAIKGDKIKMASRHRRDKAKQELHRLILKEAGELFLEQGYDRFSMRQLAERIGYSAATLYIYFRDKDDLLFTVVDDGFIRFRKRLAEAAAGRGDPWMRLAELSRAYIEFGLSHPVHYQLMFMWRSDFLTQQRKGENQPRLEAFLVLQEAVQSAMDAGVMQSGDVETYSDALWAMMHGIVALAIAIPLFDEKRIEKLAELAREMIFKAFYRQP